MPLYRTLAFEHFRVCIPCSVSSLYCLGNVYSFFIAETSNVVSCNSSAMMGLISFTRFLKIKIPEDRNSFCGYFVHLHGES